MYKAVMILKTAVYPRKTRNKTIRCIKLATHPLGDNLRTHNYIKIIIIFVYFAGKMIYLG